jgi:hypothetical protein
VSRQQAWIQQLQAQGVQCLGAGTFSHSICLRLSLTHVMFQQRRFKSLDVGHFALDSAADEIADRVRGFVPSSK